MHTWLRLSLSWISPLFPTTTIIPIWRSICRWVMLLALKEEGVRRLEGREEESWSLIECLDRKLFAMERRAWRMASRWWCWCHRPTRHMFWRVCNRCRRVSDLLGATQVPPQARPRVPGTDTTASSTDSACATTGGCCFGRPMGRMCASVVSTYCSKSIGNSEGSENRR